MRPWAAGEECVCEGREGDKAKGTHCSGMEIKDRVTAGAHYDDARSVHEKRVTTEW